MDEFTKHQRGTDAGPPRLDETEAHTRQLAAILDATPDFVGMSDRDGCIVSINAAGRRMLGIGEDGVVGRPVQDFMDEASVALIRDEILPTVLEQGVWRGETVFVGNGKRIPVSQVVLAHRDASGRLEYISTIARDISAQLHTERALRQRETEASTLASLSQQALSATDLPALFDAAVQAVARVLDAPIVGVAERLRDGTTFALRAGVGLGEGAVGNLVFGTAASGPVQTVMADGGPVVVNDTPEAPASIARWFTEQFGGRSGVLARIGTAERPFGVLGAFGTDANAVGGELTHFVQSVAAVLTNAIERQRGEIAARRAQRLRALGRLAGGIAHDFNNLLAVMLGNVELIKQQASDAVIQGSAAAAERAGREAAALVDQLVSFSRGGEPPSDGVDVNAILAEYADGAADLVAPGVRVHFDLTAGPLLVIADEQRLRQAIRNLVLNALEAMLEQGTLTVRSRYVEAPAAHAHGLPAQPFVCISVTDTGPGMDDDTLSQLFEPYFTTKHAATGRGLGLPATYGIVTEAGGKVDVESKKGHGTTLTLWWPAAPEEQVPAIEHGASSGTGDAHHTDTVLLVEDQAAIRSLLTSVLSDRGYTVLEAANGVEALELIAAHPARIRLVVTDVVMPRMSGPDMVTELRSGQPDLAVLYLSGFHQDALIQPDEPAPTAFLRKPFGIAQFVATVDELVAAPPADASAAAAGEDH